MKTQKQTRKELEREVEDLKEWKYRFFGILAGLVVLFFVFYLYLDRVYDLQQENLVLKEQIKQLSTPEIINKNNLYIGYEDGVRIGYHQDYNGTWYRCARGCEVLK